MNWRVIPGKFDIYGWQRPLNWAIEWDTTLGDLIIKAGEPIYFVRFAPINRQVVEVKLIEIDMTLELEERLKATRGITSIKKGLTPIMKAQSKARGIKKLIKRKNDDS